MQHYRKEVIHTITPLAYLLKSLDPNGIEVILTSALDKKKICQSSSDVAKVISNSFPEGRDADCPIERALETILEYVRENWPQRVRPILSPIINISTRPTARPVSIYILTNGIWDHSSDGTCGAERPIQVMIDQMKGHAVGRTQVSLQFICLGSCTRGVQRLKHLDDEIPKVNGNKD
jgi:hypothetical protein